MKHFYLFSRTMAALVMLVIVSPLWAQLPEENRVLDLGTHGISEVVTIPQFEGQYFYVAPGEDYPKPQSASNVGDQAAYTRFHYTTREGIWSDNYGGHLSKIEVDNILCVNNGTDHIYLTQYEFDGGDVSKKINWDITITVSGGVVEVGKMVPDCEGFETPDPTVLKDTTIHYGDGYYDTELSTWVDYSIENYVGFRYVMDFYENQDEWHTLWSCINTSEMNVVSSNPEVVEVKKEGDYDPFQLKGLKRGTATITVSVPENVAYGGNRPKSVQYNVTVKGDEGPKIGFYQNSEPLTELVLEGSSALPAYTIYLSEDGSDWYSGNFTITSSNEAVATIDNPQSAEVHFTFHGYGTTTITATAPGNDYTEDATASFTLTYVDPNAVDLYFTDDEGNRITSIEVGTNEYHEPVYPFNQIQVKLEQNGTEVPSYATSTLTIESGNTAVLEVSNYDSYYKTFNYSCLQFGTADIIATYPGHEGYNEKYSPATARLTVTYANTYRQPTTVLIEGSDLVDGEFNIMDTDSGSLGVKYYLPATYLQDELTNKISDVPLTITSSDESVLAVRLSDYIDGDHYYRNIEFDQRDYGTAVITVAFAGNETYAPSQASFVYSYSMNLNPMAECVVKDKVDHTVTDVVLTEGDFLALKHLVRADGEEMTYSYQATATTTNKSCWKYNKETKNMDFYPHAAGLDTIVYEYYRSSRFDTPYGERRYWPYREAVKIPVVIMPYLNPVSHCVMDLNPEGNASMSFSSTVLDQYNTTKQQLEIQSVVSAENLQVALDSMATGKKEWNDLLPGATTFNVDAGKGTIKIECQTVDGYELKVLVRDHGTATISQPSMGIAEVNYEVDEVTAVLVYLWPTGGSNPAPQHRAPAASKNAAPNAIIKSITIVPDDGGGATGIDETQKVNLNSLKLIENGQLIIIKDGVRYNAQGQMIIH